jgi:hypothetical protein
VSATTSSGSVADDVGAIGAQEPLRIDGCAKEMRVGAGALGCEWDLLLCLGARGESQEQDEREAKTNDAIDVAQVRTRAHDDSLFRVAKLGEERVLRKRVPGPGAVV